MYAIIEDSGTQYKVEEGKVIDIDLRELPEGKETIEFDKVLLVGGMDSPKIGTPYIEGAKVIAKVEEMVKGPKIRVIHFIRRKGHIKRKGHRQKYLRVKIEKILV